MYFLWQDLLRGTVIFHLVTLTLKVDLLLRNFNIDCYLVMVATLLALSSDNSFYHVWSRENYELKYFC